MKITYQMNRLPPHHWAVNTSHGPFIVEIAGYTSPGGNVFQFLRAGGASERNKEKNYRLTEDIPNTDFMRVLRNGVEIVMPTNPIDSNVVHAIVTMLATLEGAVEILPE